jgi:hypothetical protein
MPAWGADKKTEDRREFSKIEMEFFADDSLICLETAYTVFYNNDEVRQHPCWI